MTEAAPDRLWSGIQVSKVVAGTLAAVTAAVLGSFLGVAGTLAGAAMASVIGSVGTELFNNSLKRGHKHLATVAPTFVKVPAAIGTPPVAAATDDENPAHTVPDDEVATPAASGPVTSGKPIRWKPVLVGAAAVFVIAMGAIFAVEAIAGEPLSKITTGHSTGSDSTFGSLVGNNSDDEDTTPAVTTSTSPSEAPAPGESGDAKVDPSAPTDTSPSGAATSSPAPDATTEPTTGPATDAPTDTAPTGDTGTGDQTDSGTDTGDQTDSTTQQDSSKTGQEPAPAATE